MTAVVMFAVAPLCALVGCMSIRWGLTAPSMPTSCGTYEEVTS